MFFIILCLCMGRALSRPLLIDGFSFNNEPIAYARMDYLYDHVDFFLLSESNVSFQGRPRQWPTDQRSDLLKKFEDKLIVERADVTGHDAISWNREQWVRDRIALRALEAFPDQPFVLVVADGDEVPSIEAVAELQARYDELSSAPIDLHMHMFYYSFEWLSVDAPPPSNRHSPWTHAYAVNDAYLKKIDRSIDFTAHIRWHRDGVAHGVVAGGWHCSSCLSAERVVEKARSFCHATEFATPSVEWVRHAMAHGLDYLNRTGCCWFEQTAGQVPIMPSCDGCLALEEWVELMPLSDEDPPCHSVAGCKLLAHKHHGSHALDKDADGVERPRVGGHRAVRRVRHLRELSSKRPPVERRRHVV